VIVRVPTKWPAPGKEQLVKEEAETFKNFIFFLISGLPFENFSGPRPCFISGFQLPGASLVKLFVPHGAAK
jgi:hypothetical protein